MSERTFNALLTAQWDREKFAYVGLDPVYDRIPQCVRTDSVKGSFIAFNREIVMATASVAAGYKLNLGYYLKHGAEGIEALTRTANDIPVFAPEAPIILDAKFCDIGNTNFGFVNFAFNVLGVDAVTVNPYLSGEALAPFFDYADKGIFVVCRTSNPGAGEFQDLIVHVNESEYTRRLHQCVAFDVWDKWNANHNCGLVVGATVQPEVIEAIRVIAGNRMPILFPGIGEQGGDLESTVKFGKSSDGKGMLVSASRSIIFASAGTDFAEAAREEAERLHNQINRFRKAL